MVDTKFESLPDDLLFEVISCFSVPVILRLRQVSRQFHRLTHERTVWVNAYRNSTILRPPGPFPSQSATYLEQELKKSIKLHANWTSPSPQPVSRLIISQGAARAPLHRMKLVLGRYLLVAGWPMLRCYDLDSPDDAATFARPIASYNTTEIIFDCRVDDTDTSIHELEGESRVLCAFMDRSRPEITYLDLRISQGNASFTQKAPVQIPRSSFYFGITIKDDFLIVTTSDDCILLHIPTNRVYSLPPCDFYLARRRMGVLTDTHLLVLSDGHRNGNVIEAFPLPTDNPSTPPVLTRSHIGYHVFYITEPTVFSHTPANDYQLDTRSSRSSTSVTMIALVNATGTGGSRPHDEVGFLDVVLEAQDPEREGSISLSWTSARPPGAVGGNDYVFFLSGTVQAGAARLVAYSGMETVRIMAYTVLNGGDSGDESGRSIVARRLQVEVGEMSELVWDGLRGRLCFESKGHIEVIDFV